jgi:hypothetical protein
MKTLLLNLIFLIALQNNLLAQNDIKQIGKDNSVVMTWNKNTPDQEMKDDIKALKTNNGVTIKYSNLKRNSKNEITSLKIEYSDNEGNSGNQEYNNKNAIPEIKFYKINGEIGFGNPNNFNSSNNNLAFGNFDFNDLQKEFTNRIKIDTLGNNKIFSFDLNKDNEPRINKKSKIIIQKDGRKPLVIEDGKVIEGQNDYSNEEIEKIKNENRINSDDNNQIKNFGFNFNGDNLDMNSLRDELEKMQRQIQKMDLSQDENQENSKIAKPSKSDKEDLKKEMKEAKEEMIKAKKEMEEAKKELQKAKTEMKTQKI